MKILICPDSFKDALPAPAAARAIACGIRRLGEEIESIECPLADGGEGSLEALLAATGAERRTATVQDALGRPARAHWGWLHAAPPSWSWPRPAASRPWPRPSEPPCTAPPMGWAS